MLHEPDRPAALRRADRLRDDPHRREGTAVRGGEDERLLGAAHPELRERHPRRARQTRAGPEVAAGAVPGDHRPAAAEEDDPRGRGGPGQPRRRDAHPPAEGSRPGDRSLRAQERDDPPSPGRRVRKDDRLPLRARVRSRREEPAGEGVPRLRKGDHEPACQGDPGPRRGEREPGRAPPGGEDLRWWPGDAGEAPGGSVEADLGRGRRWWPVSGGVHGAPTGREGRHEDDQQGEGCSPAERSAHRPSSPPSGQGAATQPSGPRTTTRSEVTGRIPSSGSRRRTARYSAVRSGTSARL